MAAYEPTDTPSYDGSNTIDFDGGSAQRDEVDGDGDDEDDDYDPSNFAFDDAQQVSATNSADPSQVPSRTTSAIPASSEQPQKPKTVGGFIVDESEDEEEQSQQEPQDHGAPPPSQLNGEEGAHQGLGAVAQQEMQDVNLSSAQPSEDTVAAAVLPAEPSTQSLNGSTTVAFPTQESTSTSLPVPSALQNEGKVLSPTPAINSTPAASVQPQAQQLGQIPPKPTRLPNDKVGQLEDRIAADPKADIDAWLSLIAFYREKGQIDNARKTYERLFQVFPSVASIWFDYAKMEWDLDNFQHIEQILNISLPRLPNVRMWNLYLDYLRRIHPLQNDTSGQSRAIISQAFEAVLDQVGIDPDAGQLWRDYIDFIKSGPGVIGGSGWQDAQKMDLLRKAYGRACALPQGEVVKLWKEYDNFELGMNKATGRKFLQEKSPAYMTAKTAKVQLDNKLEGLVRDGVPLLPPLKGFEGRDEFDRQVALWRGWLEWEMEDPLVLKDEDIAAYRKRILYVWRQATMVMRFCPDLWFEAAQWCYDQSTDDLTQQGDAFLDQGVEANPENVLLALKKADRVESQLTISDDEATAVSNGDKLDVPYEKCHQALYELVKKNQAREKQGVAQIQESFATLPPEDEDDDNAANHSNDEDEDDEESKPKKLSRQEQMQQQISQLKATEKAYLDILKRSISHVWVQKMRAFRRVQGQGKPNQPKKGFRGVFAEARPRGQLTSDVYIASALMEYHCYQDASSTRIFERGMKLFPTDEVFALEYIRHLINTNDIVNARVVFETTTSKIQVSPAFSDETKKKKCIPLLEFMHAFESAYGDLTQIHRLEKRLREMFGVTWGSEIERFCRRGKLSNFDAKETEIVLSPMQIRPKTTPTVVVAQPGIQPSIEQRAMAGLPPASFASPRVGELALGPNGPYMVTNSPKRPLDDFSDNESPRKFMRGESPLKIGGAGKKVDAKQAAGSAGFMTKTYVPGQGTTITTGGPTSVAPTPLPPGLVGLLAAMPAAKYWTATRFDPVRMVAFLQTVDLEKARR